MLSVSAVQAAETVIAESARTAVEPAPVMPVRIETTRPHSVTYTSQSLSVIIIIIIIIIIHLLLRLKSFLNK